MNEHGASDQRKSTRIFCNVPVLLQAADGSEFSATCLDVNCNGVGIECGSILKVGQRVNLLIAGSGSSSTVPMLVLYRMDKHYGLSALGAFEDLLRLIPCQA
jgi:PilZ domain